MLFTASFFPRRIHIPSKRMADSIISPPRHFVYRFLVALSKPHHSHKHFGFIDTTAKPVLSLKHTQ